MNSYINVEYFAQQSLSKIKSCKIPDVPWLVERPPRILLPFIEIRRASTAEPPAWDVNRKLKTENFLPMPLDWIDDQLGELERAHLLRPLRERQGASAARIVVEGRELVNFAANDYLGLANDPRLTNAVQQSLAHSGWGAGASPLVVGRSDAHAQLERALATFEQAEAALLFTSGFSANIGAITALVGPGDVVFSDELNHASIVDGCRLSRAAVCIYPHRDTATLEQMLAQSEARRRLIVTDTLFSMDGDLAPLDVLAELATRSGAMLMIDEAHATGVFGAQGRGVSETFGPAVEQRIDIKVGTLSKALGSSGGFITGTQALITWLANRARAYVFSTAAPAATATAARAALSIVQSEPERRQELLQRATKLRETLSARGWDVGPSTSQIIPVLIGDPQQAVTLSQRLFAAGLFVPAIRPPSVPSGRSLLRISLGYAHTPEMVDRLVRALEEHRP